MKRDDQKGGGNCDRGNRHPGMIEDTVYQSEKQNSRGIAGQKLTPGEKDGLS